MRKLEIILWSTAASGLLLKVLHLPFAGLLIVLSLSLLMLLYFLLSWMLFPQPNKKDQILGLSIFCGIAFTIQLEAILFKVQIWPMAGFFSILGLLLTGVVLILAMAMRGGRPQLATYFNGLFRRAIPLFVLGLLLYPVDEIDILRFHYRDEPFKSELLDQLEQTTDPAERRIIMQKLHDVQYREPD